MRRTPRTTRRPSRTFGRHWRQGSPAWEDNLTNTIPLNNLALIQQRQGDYAEAEQLWLRATEIRRSVLRHDNPRTISTLLGVANMRRLQEEWSGPEEAYGEAIGYMRRNGPVASEILRDYAQVLRALGRGADALAIDEELATRETAGPL